MDKTTMPPTTRTSDDDVDVALAGLPMAPEMRDAFGMMLKMQVRKNKDYSRDGSWRNNFDEVGDDTGVGAQGTCEVLIALKQSRLRALKEEGKAPVNESVLDTVLDRAVYAAIALALYLDDSK